MPKNTIKKTPISLSLLPSIIIKIPHMINQTIFIKLCKSLTLSLFNNKSKSYFNIILLLYYVDDSMLSPTNRFYRHNCVFLILHICYNHYRS